MGLETASKIAKTVGAGRVLVPLSRYSTTRMRKHLVMIHLRNGSSNAEIAQALNCHTRTMTRLTSQLRREGNVGFGLWQLASVSTAPLNGDYYGELRAAMTTLRGDEGRLLGVKGTTLVVPPALEEAGRALLNSTVINASTNPWAGSAKLIISPWLAA